MAGVAVGLVAPDRHLDEVERRRLVAKVEKLERQVERTRELLSSEQFLAKAPTPVIEQNRSRLAEMEDRLTSFQAGLASIDGS